MKKSEELIKIKNKKMRCSKSTKRGRRYGDPVYSGTGEWGGHVRFALPVVCGTAGRMHSNIWKGGSYLQHLKHGVKCNE